MSVNETTLSSANSISAGTETNQIVQFKHIPALDGLRGIAVLMVMFYHLDFLFPALHRFVKGGFLGVDVFFVLSGFLITSILIKEYEKDGQINLKNFYLRRFFRLVPAFWVFLICLYFFGSYILPQDEAFAIYNNYNFFFAFSYLMNWQSAISEGLTGNLNHAWSLAIEEQFYIIWSLVLFKAFAENRERKQIFLWTCLMILGLIAWRIFRVFIGTNTDILYYSTDTRIDALLIGCIAAMIYSWQLLPKKVYASWQFTLITLTALATALLILFSFSHNDFSLYCGTISVFSMTIAGLILWLITRERSIFKTLLELRPLRWLGQISYGLYLWHYAFYEFGKKTFASVPLQIIVGIGLALIVSTVSFYLIERPFLKLKSKFGS